MIGDSMTAVAVQEGKSHTLHNLFLDFTYGPLSSPVTSNAARPSYLDVAKTNSLSLATRLPPPAALCLHSASSVTSILPMTSCQRH